MRDSKTIETAITAAETGHLVLATLHTNSASETVDRIIDVFPPYQQSQIRSQLSVTLEAVICQVLVPRRDGVGRVCAMEVMLGIPAVANLIRESKTYQLTNVIQTNASMGMQTRDQALRSLYERGLVTFESALAYATSQEDLKKMTRKIA
jgi:twitching motility protein PilT